MRTAAAALALTLVFSSSAHAEDPRLDRIDYSRPQAQLVLGARAGAGQRTLGIAKQLAAKGKTQVGTLGQFVRWVGRNLRTDRNKAGTFRGVDQILQDGTAGGEADRAMVIGVFARSVGVPATWVKTLHRDWIATQRKKPSPIREAQGRTFLEVFVDKRWQLLDPVTGQLYPDHDVKARALPDGYVAYDKGGDPYALVLSNRFEVWRGQVLEYLKRMQPARDPWRRKTDLLAPWRVYVTGKGGAATYAREGAKTLGFLVARVSSKDWTASLAQVKGKTLMVTVSGGVPNLPKGMWRTYLGSDVAALYEAGKQPSKPWITRTFADGTRVILITVEKYGPVELAVSEALEG